MKGSYQKFNSLRYKVFKKPSAIPPPASGEAPCIFTAAHVEKNIGGLADGLTVSGGGS